MRKKIDALYIYIVTCSNVCAGLFVVAFCTLLLLSSCSSRKFLKSGQYVLSEVKITSSKKHFGTSSYNGYLRQHPNAKWFTLFKVPLGIYCLSKADSVKGNKGLSRLWRKIGEAPIVYDEGLTIYSKQNIEQALYSEGYLHAQVDTLVKRNRHKVMVDYHITPGARHYVKKVTFGFDSPVIHQAFALDSAQTKLRQGMPLNLNTLAEERSRIINALRERGFYYLNNDFITFDIDTIIGDLGAEVRMSMRMPADADSARAYQVQHYRHVNLITERTDGNYSDVSVNGQDTLNYRGINFIYNEKERINKRVFVSHVAMRADSLYNETQLQNTYSNVNSLPAISFTNIRTTPVSGSTDLLDCHIRIKPNKPHTIGLELEGTNTSGDLGTAVALTYGNRNLFRGSELLSLKARAAYEAITGLEGYANQNYIEWSTEANLRFPTLLLPFIGIEQKRGLKANSEAKVMYDMQDRPEFHRRILTGAWAYNWSHARNPRWQHRYDLLSVNYVYMPWISDTFRKDYLEGDDPHYSVLRYSYENLFIVKTGYSFVYNSLRDATNMPSSLYQTNGFQLKGSIELAGNVLYGLSKATHSHKSGDGMYEIFGIAYSQYAKIDLDFAKSVILGEKNSLAFHVGFGLGLPYGNSTILPYEKRYFSGGANSVRGWSVRDLGPGSYKGKDGKVDFVNQTGNLKLDLNVEWRTFLFWKLHGAFFIDAGNVWNTRNYADMEGAQFKWNNFYKQIAVSYGLGLRFNFNYFILRFDGGMKAIDPSHPNGRLHYPISKPNFSRDFAFHFAVGLPF